MDDTCRSRDLSVIDNEALLRSRVDQQSDLICILKKRADEYLLKYNAREAECNELERKHDQLTSLYQEEQSKTDRLEKTVFTVGKSAQELKASRENLKEEVERIQIDYEILQREMSSRNKCLHEKEAELVSIREALALKESEIRNLGKKEEALVKEHGRNISAWEKKLENAEAEHEAELEELKGEVDGTKNQLTSAHACLQEANLNLKKSQQKEKELTDQIASLIEKNLNEKKKLLEQTEEKPEKRGDKGLAKENENLRQILETLEQKHNKVLNEFDAYKEYTGELLNKEKSLNSKLRRLKSAELLDMNGTRSVAK